MKAVLLLHGALGSASQLNHLKNITGLDQPLFTFDMKGHGMRCDGNSFSIEDLADDVLNYMNDNKITQADIFGYSMGGYVALHLALNHPSKINKVFTLGTKLNWTPEIATQEAVMLNPDRMLEKIPHYAAMLKSIHGNFWKELVLHTAEMMKRLAFKPISAEEMKSIHQSIRLAIADGDSMVTQEETITAFRNLQNGSMLVIPSAKHPLDSVDLKRLTFEIQSFL